MKITIYELLGLIKDGKAPKTIIYRDKIWEYTTTVKGTGYQYYSPVYQEWKTLQSQVYLEECLNDEVEIIEEQKKIKKLDLDGYYDDNSYCECKSKWYSSEDVLVVKINEIIDEINNLKEKKDE